MRIGIDIRAVGYQRTGDETYTLQLIKSLEKIDSENQYFLYTDVSSEKEVKKVKQLLSLTNGNFRIISVSPSQKMFWTMYSLPKQAKKDRLDILHVQYITPLFLSKNIKLVTTIHDVSFTRFPEFINKKDLFLLRLFIKMSLKKADKIIAVSKFTRNEIIDVYKVDKNKVAVIYNGGVAEEFKKPISNEDVLEFRKKYDIMESYLLFLGTLQPRKNIPFLIDSFVGLKRKYKNNQKIDNLTLVLRGSKNGHNYDNRIDEILEKIELKYPGIYKQIKFVDYISNEEIPLIFKGATAFCFTSVYEGFGLPLLESMSVGVPVIANEGSCFPEIIGDAGMLYDDKNSNDFIEKTKQLIEDGFLRRKLIEKGLGRVKFFSWDKNAEQTINLYKIIIN